MRKIIFLGLSAGLLLLIGCRQEMRDDSRVKPFQETTFFADRNSSRLQVPGTISYQAASRDDFFATGMVSGRLVRGFPAPVTIQELRQGRERYNIYCSVCHGLGGDGNGMIVQRGFPRPPSFHDPRLRDAPEGHFFQVMTNGYGAMYSYASRVSAEERWAIVAYIRALQLSRNARPEDMPVEERTKLYKGK
jgi:mono/diheme cytochrome c family protein